MSKIEKGGDNGQKLNHWVFNADGSVTEDALTACKFLYIDPNTLQARPLEFFQDKGAAEDIASIRQQHYEEKRKGKIRLLSDTIKHGMLDSLRETFQQTHQNQQSPQGGRAKSVPSVRQTTEYPQGPQPDIRPRVPLERGFTLTNRMAKKIQEKERMEAVQRRLEEARAKDQADALKLQDALDKKQAAKKKLRDEYQADYVIYPMKACQEKLEAAQAKYAEKEYKKQAEMKKKWNQRQKADKERAEQKALREQQILEQRIENEKQQFSNKKEREEKIESKLNFEDRAIDSTLNEFEKKMGNSTLNRNLQNQIKSEKAREAVEIVSRFQTNKKAYDNDYEARNIDKLQATVDLGMKIERKRKELASNMEFEREEKATKAAEKKEAQEAKYKVQKDMFKQNLRKITDRSRRNDEIIKEIQTRNQENLDKRKEIMHLRKLDQEENYTRSKNFHDLYKSKLVEKILEKAERANVIKREQERIAKACSTNRASKQFGVNSATAAAGSGTGAMTKTT